MDLFDQAADREALARAPLAERVRPSRIEDVVGQEEACGQGTFLARAIAEDRLPSLLLWGPPGSGKTTLAQVIARSTRLAFVPFSAVVGGVKEVRAIVEEARERQRRDGRGTLLFVDEIHRFNKAQQDAFLPHVERGTIVLVGATTENPSFELNAALLSRVRVVRLRMLEPGDVVRILQRALDDPQGYDGGVAVEAAALERIAAHADGDARRALNLLEAVVADAENRVTVADVDRVRSSGTLRYDRAGDQHYDIVSAFIKSLRGSDPDAALYYLARMVEAGENPRFLLRRLIIFAAEDVSNADPRALPFAVAAAQGFEHVGMPEGLLILAHCATFLATAPKSNASYAGLQAAQAAVREHGSLEVPMHLRNAPTGLMAKLGYGQGYRYPHDYGGWVEQTYLPGALVGSAFYTPTQNGYEARIREWVDGIRQKRGA